MHNMQQMMKQAEALQKKMIKIQEDLASVCVEGTSGGGLVKVVVNGKHEVKSITINESLLVPEEVRMLEDLVVAALNNANNNATIRAEEEMQKLGLPPEMMKACV